MSDNMQKQLDEIQTMLQSLLAERAKKVELWDEFAPIAKLALNSGADSLQSWEDKGYFAFLKGIGEVIEQVMGNYSAEDLGQLAKSIVSILDTIKTLTQDDVMRIAGEAAEAIHDIDQTKPAGLRTIVTATRDEDIRRGMGMLMELLRHIGKGVKEVRRENMGIGGMKPSPSRTGQASRRETRQQRLATILAPRQEKRTIKKPAAANIDPSSEKICIEGVEFDQEGFLIDKSTWNEDVAKQIAQALGIKELTDEHWKLIHFSRKENLDHSATPNMRKLCTGCNVETKHVFVLFPKAPAKTIAKIAGVSKPVGCI